MALYHSAQGYTLGAVAVMPGMPSRATLLRWVKTGKLPKRTRMLGVQQEHYLTEDDVTALRGLLDGEAHGRDYDSLVQSWQAAQRNGSLAGKPLSENTIKINYYSLRKLWTTLGMMPSVEALTVANVGKCFEVISTQTGCGYSFKDNIYKAVLSFRRHLERQGVPCQITVQAMQEIKPHRAKPAKRDMVPLPDLQRLLLANEGIGGKRTPFDRAYTRAVVLTMACAGLRRQEVLDLKPDDVKLGERPSITVQCGKGGKRRRVGISKTLLLALQDWERFRPRHGATYFCTSKGTPATSTVITKRLAWLYKMTGIAVACHALRRTFAVWASRHLTRDEVETALGHSRRDVTSLYIIIDEERLVERMNALL